MERNEKDAKLSGARSGATGSPCVSYAPREGATPEGEITALAAVYRYCLFQRREDQKTARAGDGKEAAEQGCTVETAPHKEKS